MSKHLFYSPFWMEMSLKSITTFLCLIKYRIELKKCILLTMQKRLSSLHSLLFSQNTLLAPYDGNISFCPFDDVNNNFYKFSSVPRTNSVFSEATCICFLWLFSILPLVVLTRPLILSCIFLLNDEDLTSWM